MRRLQFLTKFAVLAAALLLAGSVCAQAAASTSSSPAANKYLVSAAAKPAAETDPVPRVQDCAIVTLSTPTLYACKGKVYTAYQLQHLRERAAAGSAK